MFIKLVLTKPERKRGGYIYLTTVLIFLSICLIISLSLAQIINADKSINASRDLMIVRERSKSGVVVAYVNVCYMIEEIISKSTSAEDFENYMKRTKSGYDWSDAIRKSEHLNDKYTSLSMYKDYSSKGRYLTIAEEDLFNKGINRKFYLFSVECKTKTSKGSMTQLASFQVANPLEKFTSEYKEKMLQEKIKNIKENNDRKEDEGGYTEGNKDDGLNNNDDTKEEKDEDSGKEKIDEKKLGELKKEVEEDFKKEVEKAKEEYKNPKKIKSIIRLYAVKDY